MRKCRLCGFSIDPFMDFGRMPIGNAFLNVDQFADEYFYHMQVAVCGECHTLQVVDVPDPDQMFHDHYAYFASTSHYMTEHFRLMAEDLMARYVSDTDPFVVEIGCNDGITLQNFAHAGIPHLGVEPSSNVAEAARQKGVQIMSEFFNEQTAANIVSEHGHADLFIATNTMHHIEDTNSVAAGVAILLKPKGVMVQEDPYLGNMIEDTAYDQLYAEHMYIWSVTSLNTVFSRHGLEIFDVEWNAFHGGCMRYFLCHKGAYPESDRLRAQRAKESELGLGRPETFEAFRQNCERSRDKLMNLLNDMQASGNTVVGYGATAKSATVINYCGISDQHIRFISDTTPAKQNKFSPGAHIPVKSPDSFHTSNADVAVLFAWNHFDEINAKENEFRSRGGKWIIPVRMVSVV